MSGTTASRLVCSGCGAEVGSDLVPWRCAAARPGDDIDHVVVRELDLSSLSFPSGAEANPFVRYRELFRAHHEWRAAGRPDAEYVALVRALDDRVATVDGRGFVATPFARSDALSERLGFLGSGGVWVKDETGNVSGSHKARHLMGLAILIEVRERLGNPLAERPRLAIASCGNAALAAAVVARAMDCPLDVFVPTDAERAIVERLQSLGARLEECAREPGEPGDPCMRAFHRAVRAGALPFSCQGSENGLVIEGGETLAYEMISALVNAGRTLDRLFVQVGGGALASACAQAFAEAVSMGAVGRAPRFHAVQTRGAHPLERAYACVAERVLARTPGARSAAPIPATARERADLMALPEWEPIVGDALRYAATHRSEFMRPWGSTPASVARGILDDEAYDWRAVVGALLESGGYPIVVSEDSLLSAHLEARVATGLPVCPTGSAGLAGLEDALEAEPRLKEETVAVLFSGRER